MATLDINGTRRAVDVPPAMPLLWALRDELGLVGTKYGCGMGLCGACTVHVDGQPQRSCQLTVGAAEGRRITTIEGLQGPVAHAVRAAWADLDVPQCGYCQSGQIMAAAALLTAHRAVTDDDIDGAMRGNVCRCATYPRIRQAIHQAAKALGA